VRGENEKNQVKNETKMKLNKKNKLKKYNLGLRGRMRKKK
jgi:hypothetical protein